MAIWTEPNWLQSYAQSTASKSNDFAQKWIPQIEKTAVGAINTIKTSENDAKIKEIIADETKKAQIRPGMTPVGVGSDGNLISNGPIGTGELNYRSLEKRLLPYDKELSAKYGLLADKQDVQAQTKQLKEAELVSKMKIENDKALEKRQTLSNKFDLSTEEGKLAWKNQFNKIQTSMWQPGFATADKSTVQDPINAQLNNLIEQAKQYPELLASVGIKPEVEKSIEAPKESPIQPEMDHAASLSKLIDDNAQVNKSGVLNYAKLIDIVNQYSSKNLINLDKKLRDEIVNNAKEYINSKKTQESEVYQQKIASIQRANEDKKYQSSMNQDAYNKLQSSPEYTSYIATKDAIYGYEGSNKDANAKRKMIYDYIKSYNTGTVLDSELESTIGGSSATAGLLATIKAKAGVNLNTISDELVDAIISNMKKGLTRQKANVDRKAKDLERVYGAKGLVEPQSDTSKLAKWNKNLNDPKTSPFKPGQKVLVGESSFTVYIKQDGKLGIK